MTARIAFAAAALAAAAFAPAAHAADDTPTLAIPSTHTRIGYERVRFPGNGPRTGIVGTSYLLDIGEGSGFSLGPAVYGAISGERGGFFNIGGELAWRHRLVGPVGVELGIYAGGGGGGGAPGGGGLMLRPHADLVWDLGHAAVGVSYSKVRFNGGRVDSDQIGLVVNANSDFRFVPAARLAEPTLGGGRAGLGFDRVVFSGGAYRTPRGRTLKDGGDLPRTISMLGVRAEQSVGSHAFWGIEANRAGRGGVGGYAEYLGNVGLETEAVRDLLTFGVRVGAGMAGGGSVRTGGGLLVKGSVYSIVRLGTDLGLALEGGYAAAPDGNFRGAQGTASLVWALDGPGTSGAAARPARTDFTVGAMRYDAPRSSGGQRSLSAVSLKLDRFLTPNAYVSGSVAAAARGGASGYSSALFGAGWNQPLGAGVHIGAELLAGAAGGGGADTRGALFLPRAYAGIRLSPAIALRGGIGRIVSTNGRLDSTAFDLGVTITYGVSAGG